MAEGKTQLFLLTLIMLIMLASSADLICQQLENKQEVYSLNMEKSGEEESRLKEIRQAHAMSVP